MTKKALRKTTLNSTTELETICRLEQQVKMWHLFFFFCCRSTLFIVSGVTVPITCIRASVHNREKKFSAFCRVHCRHNKMNCMNIECTTLFCLLFLFISMTLLRHTDAEIKVLSSKLTRVWKCKTNHWCETFDQNKENKITKQFYTLNQYA